MCMYVYRRGGGEELAPDFSGSGSDLKGSGKGSVLEGSGEGSDLNGSGEGSAPGVSGLDSHLEGRAIYIYIYITSLPLSLFA